mgnify:FL=1
MIRKEDMNTLKPYKHIFTALQNNERDGLAGIREELDDILDLANGQSGGSRINAIKLLRRFFGEKRFKLREYSEVVSRYCKLMDYMSRLRWLHNEVELKEKKFSYDKGIKMNRIRLTKLIKRHENNLKWFPSHIDLKFMNHLCQKYNLHTFGYKKNKIRGYHV